MELTNVAICVASLYFVWIISETFVSSQIWSIKFESLFMKDKETQISYSHWKFFFVMLAPNRPKPSFKTFPEDSDLVSDQHPGNILTLHYTIAF